MHAPEAQSSFPSTFEIQTLRPKPRLHGPLLLVGMCAGFVLFYFLKQGIDRFFYCGLCVLAAGFLLFHYRKEHALVQDHQSAIATVTEYKKQKRGAARIKYSFVAFNGQSYTGETGWNTQRLSKGMQVPVLYRAGNPAINLPFSSFIFYSFHQAS